MKKVLFGLLLFLSGCGSLVDTPPMASISYDHNYPWMDAPMYQAIDFWNNHDAIVTDGADHETDLYIVLKDLSKAKTPRVAQYHGFGGRGEVQLDFYLEPPREPTYVGCVIAHEIGHSFGMNHVQEKDSL